MLFDTHIHTKFSFDSQMRIEAAIRKGESLGIGLTITDHLDKNYNRLFPEAYSDFSIRQFHEEYQGKRTANLLLGIECGMDPRYAAESLAFIDAGPLDYVIGSVHTMVDADLFSRANFLKQPRAAFYRAYFQYVLQCLKSHPFVDSLGHLDYPARYAPYPDKGFRYREFPEELGEVFRFLAKTDMALELNLVRFRNPEFLEEFTENYQAFRDMGGKYVTIGSDSHGPGPIGEALRDAAEFIRALGLKPVHFIERKLVYSQE